MFMIPYLSLVVYVCVSLIAGLFTSSLHVSTWFFRGLHSYLYPENSLGQENREVQGGSGFKSTRWKEIRSSTKNVSANEGERNEPPALNADGEEVKFSKSKANIVLRSREHKRRDRNKDRFRWEEGSSQIYRLTLSHAHLKGRLYFAEYNKVIVYTMVGLANLVVHEGVSFVSHSLLMVTDVQARKFDIVPFLMGLFAVYKTIWILAQVSCQSSTSRVFELMLSGAVGFIGFIVALCILFLASSSILDIKLESLFAQGTVLCSSSSLKRQTGLFMASPTLARVLLSVIAGLLAGIMVTPTHRCVRSFWLGTDQLQWNIPMAKWGTVVRFLLHLNVALPLFVSMMWIKPMGELFIASASSQEAQSSNAEGKRLGVQIWGKLLLPAPSDDWSRDFGLPRNVFEKLQLWGLFMVGLVHLCLFRINVQTYLNEALIVWYEGLHSSMVMNLEVTQAKLLLNSYFLCRAAVQFFVPGILVVLLLGMSRVWGDVPLLELANTKPDFFFLRVAALFLAWWATFSWSILTSVTLALYRVGFILMA